MSAKSAKSANPVNPKKPANIMFPGVATKAVRTKVAKGSKDASIAVLNDFFMNYSSNVAATQIWKGNLKGRLRKHVEPLTAKIQCERAGVECNNAGGVKCWICNCPIESSRKAQCEHILPVIRAIMFTGIITTAKVTKRLGEAEKDIEDLQSVISSPRKDLAQQNLLCADDLCNGFKGKSGMVLIKFSDDELLSCVPDEEKIEELVKKIIALRKKERLSYPCYADSAEREEGLEERIEDRMKKRITEVYSNICVEINEELGAFVELAELNNCEQVRNAFCQYALSKIKLHASEKALALLPKEETEEEIIARTALQAEIDAEKIKVRESFRNYEKNLFKVKYQMYTVDDVVREDKVNISKMLTSETLNYPEIYQTDKYSIWRGRRLQNVKDFLCKYLTFLRVPVSVGFVVSIVQLISLMYRLRELPGGSLYTDQRRNLENSIKTTLFGVVCRIREQFYLGQEYFGTYRDKPEYKMLASLFGVTVFKSTVYEKFLLDVDLTKYVQNYANSVLADVRQEEVAESKMEVEEEESIIEADAEEEVEEEEESVIEADAKAEAEADGTVIMEEDETSVLSSTEKLQLSTTAFAERYPEEANRILEYADFSVVLEDEFDKEAAAMDESAGGSKRRTKKTKSKKRKTRRIKRKKNNRTRKH